MKSALLSFLIVLLVFGAGMTAFADQPPEEKGMFNFGQMKPLIKKMHPDLSADELNQMYLDCHGSKGAMSSKNFNMMDGNMDIVD